MPCHPACQPERGASKGAHQPASAAASSSPALLPHARWLMALPCAGCTGPESVPWELRAAQWGSQLPTEAVPSKIKIKTDSTRERPACLLEAGLITHFWPFDGGATMIMPPLASLFASPLCHSHHGTCIVCVAHSLLPLYMYNIFSQFFFSLNLLSIQSPFWQISRANKF